MIFLLPLCTIGTAAAQRGPGPGREGRGPSRPPLFLSEEWKVTGGEQGVNPADAVMHANLELKLYGLDSKNIQITGAAGNESNPVHLWTGLCEQTCAATLRDKDNYVDLTGLAMIRWVTKTSGFHKVHPLVKLADGTWYVGDLGQGSPTDWHTDEFSIADVHWLRMNIAKVVTTGNLVNNVDLSKVDEVGFADLMPGSGHGPGGWIDVGKIEVFGKPVKRQP